ncbi:MAG: circadian clock KaiB family protein [Betaproteobacteria bacterium]
MKPNRGSEPPGLPPLILTLYIAGDNAFSQQTQTNLEALVRDCAVAATVSVVDVLESPQLTLKNRIFVTPTLVIAGHRAQESLIVGDPSDSAEVAKILMARRDSSR